MQAAISPVSGWDALGLWTSWGELFLRFELSPEGFRGKSRADGFSFPFSHRRHPPTIYHLSAFTGFALEGAVSFRGWLISSSFTWLCGAAMVWGGAVALSASRVIAAFAVYGYCSLPLLENHAILVGYADPWIAVVAAASGVFIALAFVFRKATFWILGVLFAVTPLLLRSQVLYTLALAVPLTGILVAQKNFKLLILLFIGAICVVGLAFLNGFDITLAGQRMALLNGERLEAVFGGRVFVFEPYASTQILINEAWRFLVNQSFSTIMLLALFGFLVMVSTMDSLGDSRRQALIFLLASAALLVLGFIFPQLSTDYSERFAAIGADKGHSRFLLPVGPLVILASALACGVIGSGSLGSKVAAQRGS